MLYLIGMGISDARDMSLKAVDALQKCDTVYCELYTNVWHGDIKDVEDVIRKKIEVLAREDVESDMLVEEAKQQDIALLVPGDPLTATTHVELMIECRKRGILFEVVHASSIHTAIAESGIQVYKMGRTTTLPRPQPGFKPTSPLEIIAANEKMGLHTLVLLDVGMSAAEGLIILRDNGYADHRAVVCCKLGSKDRRIKYGNVSQLIDDIFMNTAPAAIIVPGKIHFKEEEALQLWM